MNLKHLIDNYFPILYCLIPVALISGPFLPDLFLTIGVIYFFFISKEKKIFFLKNKLIIILLLFSTYITIRSLFAEPFLPSFKSSITYYRFPIFIVMMWYFIENYEKYIKFFFFISFFGFIFVLVDTYFQFFLGYDFFLFEKGNNRLTGPFGDELIVGSYVSRVLPFIVSLYLIYFKKFDKKIIFIIIFSLIICLLSGERTSFALALFYSAGIFFLFQFNRKFIIFISFISIFISLSFLLFTYQKNIFDRVYISPLKSSGILKSNESDLNTIGKVNDRFTYLTPAHEHHILSAYKIFKKNIFFGSGVKTYRYRCKDPDVYINFMSCTTHPHNSLIQILSETGLIGFSFFLLIFIILLKEFINIIKFKFKKDFVFNYYHLSQISLLLGFFQIFLIILPSGNIFNNWISIVYYLPVGFYLAYKNKKKFL